MHQRKSSDVCFRLVGTFPSPTVWLRILAHHESRQLTARGVKTTRPDEGLGLFEQFLQLIATLGRTGLTVKVMMRIMTRVTSESDDIIHVYQLSAQLAEGAMELWLQIRCQSGKADMVNIYVVGDPEQVDMFMRQYAAAPHDQSRPEGLWTWVQVSDWQEQPGA